MNLSADTLDLWRLQTVHQSTLRYLQNATDIPEAPEFSFEEYEELEPEENDIVFGDVQDIIDRTEAMIA